MATLNIPYSFTNGTTASATEVNANFNAVKTFAENSVVQADGSVKAGTAAIADNAITSAKILDGTIVDADINGNAAIGLTKLAGGALPTGITVASANIVNGTIVNEDINASAGIAASKTNIKYGSTVVNVVNGLGSISHGMGVIPTTAVITNGDNSVIEGFFSIVNLTSSVINFRIMGTQLIYNYYYEATVNGNVRVNWIAIP